MDMRQDNHQPAYGLPPGDVAFYMAAQKAELGEFDMNAPTAAAHAVRAESRATVRWYTSVRTRLVLMILLPMAGLAILTGMQARSSWRAVADADRAHSLADMSTSTMELLHQLGREQAEAVTLRDRGGVAGRVLVTAQWARTDDAITAFRHVSAAAVAASPGLEPTLDVASLRLAELAAVRSAASPGLDVGKSNGLAVRAAPADVRGLYAPVIEALLGIADVIPATLVNREMANRTRAIAALATAKYAMAAERDVFSTVLRQHAYAPGDFANLVRYATIVQERLEIFDRVAGEDARASFDRLVSGPEVQAATQLRDAALSGATGALLADSDTWYAAASHTISQLHQVELDLAAELSALATQARKDALRDAAVTIAGAVSLAIASVVIATAMATATSRRLGRLRRAALSTAIQLPAVVDEITVAADPVLAHDAHLESASKRAHRNVSQESRDEIGQVASAFATVHATALQLAADQALLRLDTEALVSTLARRSQKLVQRQLGAIDDLERAETDPDTLATYYVIDHLAARMRRNAENLLVLTGAEPGRQFSGAFPLLDVIRAAAAEIADYTRVDIASLPPVTVAGRAVSDLAHLLAELLENAATYSPPHSQVTVTAQRAVTGVVIAVYDNGIGMPPDALAAANERLRQPTTLTSALAGTLGLLVVARLATRHHVEVELRSHKGSGTAALVGIPNEILTEYVDTAAPWTDMRQLAHSAEEAHQAPGHISVPAPKASTTVHAAPVYDQPLAARFATRNKQGRHAAADAFANLPGDREQAKVTQLATQEHSHVDGALLPRRPPGAHLLPGQIPSPGGDQGRDPIDPDRVRSQLMGLSRGLAAAARTPHFPNHDGQKR